MRGLGALSVILYHVVDSTWDARAIGVAYSLSRALSDAITVFFALSGFLIMLPFLLAAAQSVPLQSIGRYYRTRAMRIFPGYLVIFLVVNFVLGAANVQNVRNPDFAVGTITDPATLLANLTLTQSIFPATLSTGILPAWSLTTELGFYLVVPLLALGVVRFMRRRGPRLLVLFAPGALFVLIGTITRAGIAIGHLSVEGADLADLNWGSNWFAVLMRSTLAQADAFGYGMLAAATIAAIMSGKLRAPRRRTSVILCGAIAVLIAASLVAMKADIPAVSPICIGLGTAIVMYLCAVETITHRAADNPLIRTLEQPVVRYLGSISMSLYLWHMPILQWLAGLGLIVDSYPSLLLVLGMTIGITVTLSVITYHLVEKPALELGRGGRRPRRRRRSLS
nr:acyltransferase [Microbacterium caowuchunii]